jgi:hypothetical protein
MVIINEFIFNMRNFEQYLDSSTEELKRLILRGKIEMNKCGVFSFLMVIASVVSFFLLRGPNADLSTGIIVLGSLSLIGVGFAVLSKKWLSAILGVLLNGVVLTFAFLLLLAKGIGG